MLCHSRFQPSTLSRISRAVFSRGLQTTTNRSATANDFVRIVEVGPRDGLQNEKKTIPLETKVELLDRLVKTGVQTIEAGSFVHPKWVPQMANSSQILDHILDAPPSISSKPDMTYQFLLPNVKGLENFFKSQDAHASSSSSPPSSTPAKLEASIFMAATEAFSQRNTNCSIAESLARFAPLIKMSKERNCPVRAYISVALGCPYEGPDVSPNKVADLALELLELGAYEVCVADTTGMGTVPRTRKVLQTLKAAGVRTEDLAFHFHDTYAQALVNTVVALEEGIRVFDSAVGGLGGCPYSPGATGNVATEDLVHLLNSLGMKTGIDLEMMAGIGSWISEELVKQNESRAGKALLAKVESVKRSST